MKLKKNYFLLLIVLFSFNSIHSQISQGGLPKSFEFKLPDDFEVLNLKKPNIDSLNNEDKENDSKGIIYRFGVNVPVNFSIDNSGTWDELPNNLGKIWRLKIKCNDALALGIYYDNFLLPPNSKLFIYNESKSQILGAYSEANNHDSHLFANELIFGETVILEYFEPFNNKIKPNLSISEVTYAYRGINDASKGFGSSGSCEVNINCAEGSYYSERKKGVARIYVKIGTWAGWCTGSLINNSNSDCTPYFLTADHCTMANSTYATAQDLNQWIFYFNYEASGCSNPATQPSSNTLTGCSYVAYGGMSGGSDFDLLELNSTIPSSYDLYFLGWDRSGATCSFGRSVHHPVGDIKKVSTYSTSLTTGTYSNDFTCATNAHWVVQWAQTTNGWGVTEGGSSGSPLFDNYGRIIGTLTGGASLCSNLYGIDYYGKLSYHWQSNGANNYQQIQPWLDPSNSHNYMDGFIMSSNTPVANFVTVPTVIYAGQSVHFLDYSTTNPISWDWNFDDGYTSTAQNPYHTYLYPGTYVVALTATSRCGYGIKVKTIVVQDDSGIEDNLFVEFVYIFPNPALNSFSIKYELGFEKGAYCQIYDMTGKIVQKNELKEQSNEIDISVLAKGVYSVKIFNGAKVCVKKLSKI